MLITPMDSIAQTKMRGINASVNIEIDKNAELSLIIDKGNGDYLKLKGEARLNGGIDPSGKTTLTGRYEFTEGSYEMSFNFIKRKFDIKEGSYILSELANRPKPKSASPPFTKPKRRRLICLMTSSAICLLKCATSTNRKSRLKPN
ncbi:translocation/assembly module TamB domain-containing protein [Flavobacterium sp. 3HN19-14]|uniref:translocation/assembly module TamB domain-containing protein n=1 Tax=Flavobacterium sp. 3HN19-14 TaxID=3448133 RepID=UPI003EDFED72